MPGRMVRPLPSTEVHRVHGCPDRPRSDSPVDLGFRRRRMVRWLDPGPLVAKETKAVISGPFGSALPCAPEDAHPDLFALPGNHDWYDGLTGFLRIFCQGRWVGGWRTGQTRSYFALKLPHRWWLWAIDISFDAFIDRPQLEYFAAQGRT